MEADFSGYATKAGLKCSDGRTITPNAFQHMDGMTVPLVWQHSHGDPKNVLGHAKLEARKDGVYAYCFFNKTPSAQHAKAIVEHGDVKSLSIYANQLVEKSKQVLHGMIREVSLVLSGANPGAQIENVRVAHSDGSVEEYEDEAIIYAGLEIQHSDLDDDEDDDDDDLEHAEEDSDDEKTVKDVYDTLNEEQKSVVHFMIGAALEEAEAKAGKSSDSSAEHSDINNQEGTDMGTRNLFEQNGRATTGPVLSHSDLMDIMSEAQKPGATFQAAAKEYALAHGIDDIELLFPDAKAVQDKPEFISRRMEWVAKVLDGTKHAPFSKIKTVNADITADEARAKGYVKGAEKVEEVFGLLKRVTGPTTIYKKQKLDRDDIIDITDIDIVAFLKAEMRMMIEEELARAVLVGDGRSNMSPDKIKDPAGSTDGTGIRSILHDADLYAIKRELAANVSPADAVKGLVRSRTKFRGSGKPTLFISDSMLTDIMLLEDRVGRAIYETEQALADKLRVESIVPVELFEEYEGLVAIMVNLSDYTIGSTRGGELTSFEDFDIDFNQHKYLQETRLSGALTKPFSAVVVTRAQGTLATASAPSFDGNTNTITIPESEGVNYLINDEVKTGDVVIDRPTEVEAQPKAGYYLASNTTRSWTFTV